MERTQVESINISSIGYDEDTATLEIEFHSGSIYQYFDIPAHVYENFIEAPSKGFFYAVEIKGHYGYVKV